MKTFASLLLISATLAGTAAYAQDNQGHSLTRAQVVAELQAARAAGQVTFGDIDEPAVQVASSSLTREQVRAEAAAGREHGPVAFGGEGYPDTGA